MNIRNSDRWGWVRQFPRLWPEARRGRLLSEEDWWQLRQHLDGIDPSLDPGSCLLAHVLHYKLSTADLLLGPAPKGVANGGATVVFAIDNERARHGILRHQLTSFAEDSVIPTNSLLGATLAGMRIGQRAPLLCKNRRVASLWLLDVEQPVIAEVAVSTERSATRRAI